MTTILNKMEEKGLIERRILNGNRRSFHIFLTAVGKEKQQLVDTAFSEIEKKALADISEKEFEQFMSVYHRIYSYLSGISEKQTENDTYLRKKEHKAMNKLKRYLLPEIFQKSIDRLLLSETIIGSSNRSILF